MFSTSTKLIEAAPISAPSGTVRRHSSARPAPNSARPARNWKTGEKATIRHSSPIGLISPREISAPPVSANPNWPNRSFAAP